VSCDVGRDPNALGTTSANFETGAKPMSSIVAGNYDAVIVGAGPAGLTAATYLGRFRRRTLVLDGGPPRASWIPTSHNTPGFPEGLDGPSLLVRLREQADRYGAEVRNARAETLIRDQDLFRVKLADGGEVVAPFVLLATGVVDRKPDLPGLDAAIRRGVVRVCPICDAYEAIDAAIAVLGDGPLGVREAMFLRTYSDRVTLLHIGEGGAPSSPGSGELETLAIAIEQLTLGDKVSIETGQGPRDFDCVYLALGCELQNRLAVLWGADHDNEGNLIVDAHQQTSVEGLYAAGDVVRGLNQITVATAEAAIAATDIHRRLRGLTREIQAGR
jgi:thioredoxin reductase (NADPH)